MTDTMVPQTEVAVLQRRLTTATAQLAVYRDDRYSFSLAINRFDDRAQERLLLMFDHVTGCAYHAPQSVAKERDSLVHVLPLIFESTDLWPDGQLGLMGKSGFIFGIVPFAIDRDASKPITHQAVEWSAHS